jgi:hypothetical protein
MEGRMEWWTNGSVSTLCDASINDEGSPWDKI